MKTSSAMSGLPPPVHRSQRVALLVLDVISTYAFPGGNRLLAALEHRAPNIAAATARARKARVPVIYVNDAQGQWDSDFPRIVRTCLADSPRVKSLTEQLRPLAGDHVLLKPRHSAFYGTPLEALLEHLRVSSLIITGVSAESCVLATACDAHTHGFRLIIPGDTIAGADHRAVKRTLESVGSAFKARVPQHMDAVRFERGRLVPAR
jgi:nicotinamidase-related amidase